METEKDLGLGVAHTWGEGERKSHTETGGITVRLYNILC